MSSPLQRIAIRTHAGSKSGMGHLVRMRHLAAALERERVEVLFLLDAPDAELNAVVAGLNVRYLQPAAAEESVLNQRQDAQKTIEQLAPHSVEGVVVDDYRLDAEWESVVQQAGYRIVAIDDTATRRHQCDLLLDQKWRGEVTHSGYQELVPAGCKRLLGPDYALLSPEYLQLPQKSSAKEDEKFRVLFSLGGGGNLDLLADLIESLIGQPGYERSQMLLQAVVGPASSHRQRLLALAEQDEVELLIGKSSLYDSFCSSALVVGAAGGSVYELARLRVPVISFSMSENQQTPQQWLDDIGHYLHLPNCAAEDIRRLAQLILLVKAQYSRIQQLFASSRITLDGRGAERVATEIGQLFSGRGSAFHHPAEQHEQIIEQVQEHHLRLVNDRDINHYLQCRNLLLNRGNMIKEQAIRPIVHYRWWLQTQRTSFLLSKEGEPKLYIWQERIMIMDKPYWIGGWFVCGEGCQYQDTLYALSKQLEWTDKHYPDTPWIAVISRENHFVKLLNEYQGFIEVAQESARGAVIATAFPKASFDRFYFVTRDPV